MPKKKPASSSAGQTDSFLPSAAEERRAAASGPVECLGMTFPSDDARRAHFTDLLRAKLKDPAFRATEGFPIGSDDDIIAMSDPPYYTACPNPFLDDFVRHYGKPYDPKVPYVRKPFAVDVSEGKTDPLYKAHSYHTKVPHLAIVPSILHYTEPGDLVLDGFCGTGMTGVAAQWCGCAPPAYRAKVEADWKAAGWDAPKWGARRAILNDLSPIATFIAANYNLPFDVDAFAEAGRKLLDEVEAELGWMYETMHTDGKTKGRIEYTVWSQVYRCPECSGEVVFLDEALDEDTKRVRESFPCPHCAVELTKRSLERYYENRVDSVIGKAIKTPKRKPSIVSYKVGGGRYEKTPDERDLATLRKIEAMPFPVEVPSVEIPPMHMTHERARMDTAGITHIHHFFLPRAAHALAALWRKAKAYPDQRVRMMLLFMVEQAIWTASLLNRYRPSGYSQVNQYLTGVYYVASQHAESSPSYILEGKLGRLASAFALRGVPNGAALTTATAASFSVRHGSVDYIFTDPPFGENIYYADMNFMIEAWHRVQTHAKPEAIIDRHKKKGLAEYERLMEACFREYNRVLKPGRWMTVVFHNSRNAVWNAIQIALQNAGFVVADVRTLDKQQGSYRQVTSTAMKQDLVISAYKPNGGLEDRFAQEAGSTEGAWDFVRTHLKQLPVFLTKDNRVEVIAERTLQLLNDRMIAFHVVRSAPIPLSAAEFHQGLAARFPERDGMYFLPEQVAEYDKKRLAVEGLDQLELFVKDESSAIEWLRQQLKTKPMTLQELTPLFLKELSSWEKFEKTLELRDLLAENFLRYDGREEVPSQIHQYLSTNWHTQRNLAKDDPALIAKARERWYVPDPAKLGDLEKLRTKGLMKEFWTYLPEGYTPKATDDDGSQLQLLPRSTRSTKGKTAAKLKIVRLEAVRAGFKHCWQQKDYDTIRVVGDRLPGDLVEEDEKLLRYYQMAGTKLGEDE